MSWYPFKFEPILKKTLWGGSEIGRFKQLDLQESGIGESWELSQVPESVSVVSEGPLKGKTLTELMEMDPEAVLGTMVYKRFGMEFPLLVKFIDAEDDLSIQVHPDDKLARERHGSYGKTEMWYVIDAKPGARLISGFSRQIDAEEYTRRIATGTMEEVLKHHYVEAGDVFFLPAGRVHAIGSGLFIAEIQQSSNVTYRMYDYDRKDADGNSRELHTELAKDAIDYQLYNNLKSSYRPVENGIVSLISCPYFTTSRIHLKSKAFPYETPDDGRTLSENKPMMIDCSYHSIDSFVIYVCMKGEGRIQYSEQDFVSVHQGETVLLPAALKTTMLSTETEMLLLETYIL